MVPDKHHCSCGNISVCNCGLCAIHCPHEENAEALAKESDTAEIFEIALSGAISEVNNGRPDKIEGQDPEPSAINDRIQYFADRLTEK